MFVRKGQRKASGGAGHEKANGRGRVREREQGGGREKRSLGRKSGEKWIKFLPKAVLTPTLMHCAFEAVISPNDRKGNTHWGRLTICPSPLKSICDPTGAIIDLHVSGIQVL